VIERPELVWREHWAGHFRKRVLERPERDAWRPQHTRLVNWRIRRWMYASISLVEFGIRRHVAISFLSCSDLLRSALPKSRAAAPVVSVALSALNFSNSSCAIWSRQTEMSLVWYVGSTPEAGRVSERDPSSTLFVFGEVDGHCLQLRIVDLGFSKGRHDRPSLTYGCRDQLWSQIMTQL